MTEEKDELTFVHRKKKKQRRIRCIITIVVIVAVFIIGFLIGYFSRKASTSTSKEPSKGRASKETREKTLDTLLSSIDRNELRENVRTFSKRPHIAGSERQKELAEMLKQRWISFGFDKVEMPAYDVLLSYPQTDKPNTVTLMYRNGTVIYQSLGEEKVHDPAENDTLVVRPVLGYAPAGTHEGELVYVNYGRVEDFEKLKNELNVSVDGKIAIMRYGKIFRGDKVANAARFNASGAILYTDPKEYAPEGTSPDKVYPNGQWMPPTGVQRGSIYTALGAGVGDPQTPVLPSIEGIYRRPLNESELPTIPAQPISYGDAEHFLKHMKGNKVPEDWKGALPITYRLGPGFNNDLKVRLELHNKIETKTIYDVIGTINGQEEPDRWVLIGNHRDSWVFGAVDAVSGTSTTSEIARVLGKLRKTGWRPRRSIKVCSWGGEEYSLIGSREWVEEHREVLDQRAVAYLNVDISVGGNFVLEALSTPLLQNLLIKWISKIKDPNAHDDKQTVYDIMVERNPSKEDSTKPNVEVLTSVSDFAHFYHHMGIPSTDMTYQFGYNNKMSYYPVYHTQHDTFKWVEKFVDPEFKFHETMAKILGGMLLDIAESPLLPMDVVTYSDIITKAYKLLNSKEGAKLEKHGITLKYMAKAVEKFNTSTHAFNKLRSNIMDKDVDSESFSVLRRLNDQMVSVEKAFIYPYGLPGRPITRHVAFAPERYNAYGGSSFPGISDTLFDAARGGNWSDVDLQISVVMQSILSAADVLQPVNMFSLF